MDLSWRACGEDGAWDRLGAELESCGLRWIVHGRWLVVAENRSGTQAGAHGERQGVAGLLSPLLPARSAPLRRIDFPTRVHSPLGVDASGRQRWQWLTG